MTFPVDPIQNALAEDIGSGDLTSTFLVPPDHQSRARIFAKEDAIVGGTEAARAVYGQVDPQIVITVRRRDGDSVRPGDTVLEIAGRTRSILTGERVALNFIQRLSGVATVTRKFVDAVAGTGGDSGEILERLEISVAFEVALVVREDKPESIPARIGLAMFHGIIRNITEAG